MNQYPFRSKINTTTIKNYFYIADDLHLASKLPKNNVRTNKKLLTKI